jgi:HAD superfamily, subfamily IIIB (Acid phosphatase)
MTDPARDEREPGPTSIPHWQGTQVGRGSEMFNARMDKGHSAAGRFSGRLKQALATTFLITMMAMVSPAAIQAADCPPKQPEPRIPPATAPFIDTGVNIDTLKSQLIEYKEGKDGKPGNYDEDVARVFEQATTYVKQRAAEKQPPGTKRLAVVLDIDETSLSNWPSLKANNFGFIKGGTCFQEPTLACGFDDWILKSSATAIAPALDFFNAAKKANVALIFITGRRESQRDATIINLDRAKFEGWAELHTRRDDDHNPSIVDFKRGEREKVDKDYIIIVNIGDQKTDLDDGKFAECTFKVPNPFYFIP